jgi:1,4-alpha-glucan branching enzyme
LEDFTFMLCLALVLELHHPLPGLRTSAGYDWTTAAVDCYWPALRAVWEFAERRTRGSLTLAISPGWVALASDSLARERVLRELDRRPAQADGDRSLQRFIIESWGGDLLSLARRLATSESVEVITTTSSYTWLPSVAQDPVVARAQISLAARNQALRLGVRPSGIWLPFLSYLPGLESVMGECGLRYFGVNSAAFLRGTSLPPDYLVAPLITPTGVAAYAVSPEPTQQVVAGPLAYGRDPRYQDSAMAGQAAAEHADHFLEEWRTFAMRSCAQDSGPIEPISVAAMAIHDLARGWSSSHGVAWLHQVLSRLANLQGAVALSLGQHLDRNPSGLVGRPGPSSGGILSARPHASDLFARCRSATDLLNFVVEVRDRLDWLGHRTVAQMTRHLLCAQQLDWSMPFCHAITPDTGLKRAQEHLDAFYELAGLLLAGRRDRRQLRQLGLGPAYLTVIDLEWLAGS